MPTAAITAMLVTAGPKARTVALVANYADHSVSALSISNPASISFTSELTDATYLINPVEIAVDRKARVAWVCATGYISAIDVANPASMSRLGSFSDAIYARSPSSIALDTDNGIVFALEGLVSGLQLTAISTANPASPTRLGSVNISGGDIYWGLGPFSIALDVTAKVAYCMVGHFAGGGPVRIVAVSYATPASLSILGTVNLTNAGSSSVTGGIALHSDRQTLFVAYGAGDFSVVNVANPASMSESFNYTALLTAGGPGRVSYLPSGHVLVCASSDDAMKTLNVSNLASVTVTDTESGATYLDDCRGHAVDPYNGNIYVAAANGDDFSSYSCATGSMTFIANYTSATNINEPRAVALL